MIDRITICMFDKTRALYLADYLSSYGISVKEVVVFLNRRCTIIMFGDEAEIMNLVYQFHDDY